ncbi:MAG: hypothetical protein ACOC20_01355, partial [Oceanicaulis sp.]
GREWHAAAIAMLILGQLWAIRVMLRDPKAKAPWYNGTGVTMYVSGMMIAAFALRGLGLRAGGESRAGAGHQSQDAAPRGGGIR